MLITIEGIPLALKRPKICRRKMYNPQCKEMNCFGWLVQEQLDPKFLPIAYPVRLEIVFEMPIPKSLSKKKQNLLEGMSHCVKPDISNLIKFVEDSLNGIVWVDDKCISQIIASKCYSFDPKTVINVRKIK